MKISASYKIYPPSMSGKLELKDVNIDASKGTVQPYQLTSSISDESFKLLINTPLSTLDLLGTPFEQQKTLLESMGYNNTLDTFTIGEATLSIITDGVKGVIICHGKSILYLGEQYEFDAVELLKHKGKPAGFVVKKGDRFFIYNVYEKGENIGGRVLENLDTDDNGFDSMELASKYFYAFAG